MKIDFLRLFAAALPAVFVALSGCDKNEDRLTLQDTQDITEEALTDSYFQDLDDMAGVAIESPSENQYSGGRTATTITIEDVRFKCQGVVITIEPHETSTVQVPKGVITVDFGVSGCADLQGNIRKGKLLFTYAGWRFQSGSTVVLTTGNYFINGVKLEGTRTLTNLTGSTQQAPKFNAKLQNGKAIFSDGTEASRISDITWSWVRAAHPSQDQLVIDQSSTASGVTRAGRTYEVSLLQALQYKRFCGIAVEGIKKYTLDGNKEIRINYGDGTCDKSVSITINGNTRNITIN